MGTAQPQLGWCGVTSVDVQRLDLVPRDRALVARFRPAADGQILPVDHHDSAVLTIHGDGQTHQAAEDVARVRFAPVEFHDSTVARAAA